MTRVSVPIKTIRHVTFVGAPEPFVMTASAVAISRLGPLALMRPLDVRYPPTPAATSRPIRSRGVVSIVSAAPVLPGASRSRPAKADRGIAPGAESPLGPSAPRGPRSSVARLKSCAVNEPLRTLALDTALARS